MMRKFVVKVNGKEYIVEVEELISTQYPQSVQKTNTTQIPERPAQVATVPTQETVQPANQSGQSVNQSVSQQPQGVSTTSSFTGAKIVAPMSGVILKVLVSTGQKIEYGQKTVILEAMKMENDIVADKPGVVKRILVKEGDTVDTGQVLIELE